jgi:hypothetical protein
MGAVIPYAGNFGGFMPVRIGGSALSSSRRDASVMEAARTPFRLSPGRTDVSMQSGSVGTSFGLGSRAGGSLRQSGAMGLPGDLRKPISPGGSSVMPPYLGYPFYQPPSWSASYFSGVGMPSM